MLDIRGDAQRQHTKLVVLRVAGLLLGAHPPEALLAYVVRHARATHEPAPGDGQRPTLIAVNAFVNLLASFIRYLRESKRHAKQKQSERV